MSNFSSKTKYVEARPRREKKLGRGGSVVSVVANGGGSGVSKSYVDYNFVTLATEQTIPGAKDFVGGIKVNGMPISYNSELGVWEFIGDLFVTGNFAWGSSIDGFKPSTVMDAVRVDGSTIIKKKDANGDWYLYAPGGGSGGSGGGLTLGDVVSYLSDNDYTTKTDVNSLIALSLAGYATEQWVANKGYLTSSALNGLASQSWVGDNYLATSGGLMQNGGGIRWDYNINAWDNVPAGFVGVSNFSSDPSMGYYAGLSYKGHYGLQIRAYGGGDSEIFEIRNNNSDAWQTWRKLLHSGNYSDLLAGGTINGSITAIGNIYLGGDSESMLVMNRNYYNRFVAAKAGGRFAWRVNGQIDDVLVLDESGYLRSPIGFVGNLTGNADSATLLGNRAVSAQDFDVLNFANNGLYCFDGDYVNGVGLPPYYSWNYSVLNMGLASGRRQQIAIPYDTVKMFVRTNVDDTWKAWREVAFVDSTVEAANRLAAPRTIWGQSFDGTENITHGFRSLSADSYNGGVAHSILNNQGSPYGLLTRIFGNGSVSLQAQREANDAECFNLLLNHLGGNVAIGGTTADAKLHVHGTTILGGDTTINGNLLVNGNVSWFSHSQRSLKNIISEQGLSLAQLERIKPIKFYWKDGRDMVLHVGGVADVFAEVLPEVVARNLQDILCLNYVDAAFYVGASLIAPVLDHERRITKGEAGQEALKKENAKLKRELEEVKSKLNQLVA